MTTGLGKRHIWPAIVIGLLAIDTGVGMYMMHVANSDPSVAVEPDYYDKAVKWDSTEAQARRNAALGWTIVPTVGPLGDGRAAAMALTLRDRAGAPVAGARIEVEAIPIVAAGHPLFAVLADAGAAGDYAATLPMTLPGLWEVQLVATRAGDRFTADLRFDTSLTQPAIAINDRPGAAIPARLQAGMRPMTGAR